LSPLFPGCDVRNLSDAERRDDHAPSDRLELFYVGGVTPPLYDLKPMFDVVQAMDTVCLTLCCRESEWEKAKSYYAPLDGAKVQIVHAFGDGLRPYYARADLFGLIWKPHPYLDFAMPLKLFEALGYGVPIVASAGTEAARFVSQEGIGWVASTAGELRQLLSHLQAHPLIVAETRKHVKAVRRRHTWLARAQTVVDILASPTVEALKWPA
jgi:glycosyltransferase involved in cell wall biosynthesis